MKTVILFSGNSFSRKANYYLALMISLVFLANSILGFTREDSGPFTIALAVLQLLFGIIYPLYVYTIFNPNSRFSPKAILEDDQIILKMGLFKEPEMIDLSKVEKVTLGLFSLSFETSDNKRTYNYTTSDEASRSLKRAVRKVAESRNIPVIGG